MRASKTVNDTKTTYQYLDGKLYYQETNGDDTYFYYDSYGNITAIACYPESGTSSYVLVGTNSLGDVNALYNANGDLLVKYEYDAWGKVIAETDANGNALIGSAKTWSERNPFRYRGYYYDAETQLYYLQSRYYDPEVGRFVNADSLLDTSNAQGYNVYSYCSNNPVMREDPNGHLWDIVIDVISIVYSAYLAIKEPEKISNWVGLAADVVSAVVPVVSGGGVAVRAAAKADDFVDIGKGLSKADDVYDSVKVVDNIKNVPNPYGKNGGLAHQNEIARQVSNYSQPGFTVSKEVKINTPNGIKPYRYADFSVQNNVTGEIWYGNVGKQLNSGLPCARERYAISDIEGAGNIIKFFPYN